jgi:hypothetical protein
MNERIKEFAEQAGATVCGGYTSHAAGSWSDTGDIDSRTLDVEKFAELIVLECMSIVKDKTWGGTDLALATIKEHFGVK